MPYGDFTQRTQGPIAEREWAVGRRIESTAVTSCIILAAPANAGVFAIHLSIFGVEGSFGQDDAERVIEIMRRNGADMTNVHVFGEFTFWGDQIEGYAHLRRQFTLHEHQASGTVRVSPADVGVGTSGGCCTIM